jgi:hypothetical protein
VKKKQQDINDSLFDDTEVLLSLSISISLNLCLRKTRQTKTKKAKKTGRKTETDKTSVLPATTTVVSQQEEQLESRMHLYSCVSSSSLCLFRLFAAVEHQTIQD